MWYVTTVFQTSRNLTILRFRPHSHFDTNSDFACDNFSHNFSCGKELLKNEPYQLNAQMKEEGPLPFQNPNIHLSQEDATG